MKKTFVFLVLILSVVLQAKAQYISLNGLISLREKDFDEINEILELLSLENQAYAT